MKSSRSVKNVLADRYLPICSLVHLHNSCGRGRGLLLLSQQGRGGHALPWALWVLREHRRPGGHMTSSHPASSRLRPQEQGPFSHSHGW